MALTEKGKIALFNIKEHFPKGQFSAKDLSDACGEKIVAATLNSVAENGYLIKLGGSPVKYEATEELFSFTNDAPKGCDKTNLERAKRAKNDDFYTKYDDIEAEILKYRKQFRGKIVFLPCDDHNPEKHFIEFWNFFVANFEYFGLRKLIATHYDPEGKEAYKIWIDEDLNGDGEIDEDDVQLEEIEGTGDFRSPACTEILHECDIVCTNPPFSQFRDFVDWILKANKQCLIIGSQNAFSYQEIFKAIMEDKLWIGYNKVKKFYQPDNSTKEFGNICWFTNMVTTKRYEELILTEKFYKEKYPKYDNYDAINVDRVADIPKDYHGVMGVPITFLEKYNPNQFELIGLMASTSITDINFGYPYLNGKKKYARVLIQER